MLVATVMLHSLPWLVIVGTLALAGEAKLPEAPAKPDEVDTLAHELGHFFGLDHHTDSKNLMKQRPRNPDAAFGPKQIAAIRRGLKTFRGEK
jgi:predicted Zn-dependent protease